MQRFVCVACGTQFAESPGPPASCPICDDPRQYVPEPGQRWTTLDELRGDHANRVADEGELVGIGTEPWFAIGQRALLVPFGEQRVLWDCVTLLDDATADEVERRGGLAAIAISHPHYYSGMVEWAQEQALLALAQDRAGAVPALRLVPRLSASLEGHVARGRARATPPFPEPSQATVGSGG